MKTPTSEMDGIKIPDRLYFRIGDVAELLGVKTHVLRYWESEFSIISPQKSNTGHRVYKRSDVEVLVMIRHLLYKERYSIEGAKRRIRELRQAKGLKSFREEVVTAGKQVSELLNTTGVKNQEQIREEVKGLRRALATPLRKLFKY
jgi:DNA-binding transcriptional MerR regulator